MAPVTDELFMTDHSDASTKQHFTVQGGASLLYSLVWWFPTWGSRSSKGSKDKYEGSRYYFTLKKMKDNLTSLDLEQLFKLNYLRSLQGKYLFCRAASNS